MGWEVQKLQALFRDHACTVRVNRDDIAPHSAAAPCLNRDLNPKPRGRLVTPSELRLVQLRLLFITAVPIIIQSCACGGRRIEEDMCYEIRRAEACVD